MFSDSLLIYTKLPLLNAFVYKVMLNPCSSLSFFCAFGSQRPTRTRALFQSSMSHRAGVWSLDSIWIRGRRSVCSDAPLAVQVSSTVHRHVLS